MPPSVVSWCIADHGYRGISAIGVGRRSVERLTRIEGLQSCEWPGWVDSRLRGLLPLESAPRPLRSVKRHLYVLGRMHLKTMLRRCPRGANGFVGSAPVMSTPDAARSLAGFVLSGLALTL